MDSIVLPSLPTYLFEPSVAGLLSLALTIVLPLLAALLMKSSWSPFTKGLVLLAIATVKAFVEAWIGAETSHEHFDFVRTVYADLVNFGIAVISYMGLLRGTPAQQAAITSGPVKDQPVV
jgi:hypothetical protein